MPGHKLLYVLLFLPLCGFGNQGFQPNRTFTLTYETDIPLELYKGYYFECLNDNCFTYDTLREENEQLFRCGNNECKAVAYDLKDNGRIAIRFNDKVRLSNVFGAKAYRATYKITVRDDDLLVQETTGFLSSTRPFAVFVKFLIITLLIELPFALYFFRKWKLPFSNLKWVALVNIISLIILLFVLRPLIENILLFYILGEIVAIILEALGILLLMKSRITVKQSFTLSAIINVAGFLVGGLVMTYFFWFY